MDTDAFDAYFSPKYSVLVGHVTALWGDREEASEPVQEAFVRAWTKRREFGRHPHPDAWIRTVARNLLTDGWRKRRRYAVLDREPVAPGNDSDAWLSLQGAIRELPPNHRDAIVLHHLADLPVDRVADEPGASPGTVRVWLSRGRNRLGVLLDDERSPTMREEELRDLLSGYTNPGEPGPTAPQIRGRATRRRMLPAGLAAVAVVTVGALLVPPVATLPAVPVPAATPVVTGSAVPMPSPTPTSTPSLVPSTPVLSCPEVRDAWRAALMSRVTLPQGLGSKPSVLSIFEDGTVTQGTIDGRLVLRVFPRVWTGTPMRCRP